MELYPHQLKAIEKLKNGSILCGDVGTGKSRTALAYFFIKVCGGAIKINGEGSWGEPVSPRDLYIITTAKKRDSLEWESEAVPFQISTDSSLSVCGIKMVVDSWNNIKKYRNIYGAFFIFDEQRVSGSGAWVKAFLQIAKKNQWILLSATPGDTWKDYIPVFMANGFYRYKTDFYREHCIMNPYTTYPKIDRYTNELILVAHRNDILVRMRYKKIAEQVHKMVMCRYDKVSYMRIFKDRWDIYDEVPIDETGKLMYLLRKVVNADPSRLKALSKIIMDHKKLIVFYNYTYELEMIKEHLSTTMPTIKMAEWNGIKHEEIPDSDFWVYLVQYSAGAEGWNCITTNAIAFYSQNYSYRMTIQAAGRIDRMNTPFSKLYYYHFKSPAPIDAAISRALANKRNFNEKAFLGL